MAAAFLRVSIPSCLHSPEFASPRKQRNGMRASPRTGAVARVLIDLGIPSRALTFAVDLAGRDGPAGVEPIVLSWEMK